MQPPAVIFIVVLSMRDHRAHGVQDLRKRLHHVFSLFDLVFGVTGIETQYGNAVFVHHFRIDLAIVVDIRNSFSPSCHTYTGTVEESCIFFESCTITTGFLGFSIHHVLAVLVFDAHTKTISRLSHATPVFNMITTWEI